MPSIFYNKRGRRPMRPTSSIVLSYLSCIGPARASLLFVLLPSSGPSCVARLFAGHNAAGWALAAVPFDLSLSLFFAVSLSLLVCLRRHIVIADGQRRRRHRHGPRRRRRVRRNRRRKGGLPEAECRRGGAGLDTMRLLHKLSAPVLVFSRLDCNAPLGRLPSVDAFPVRELAPVVSAVQLNSRTPPIGIKPNIVPRTKRPGCRSTAGPLNVELGQIFQLLGKAARQNRLECLFMSLAIARIFYCSTAVCAYNPRIISFWGKRCNVALFTSAQHCCI